MQKLYCETCEAPIETRRVGGGRGRRYCSDSCRQTAYRKRQNGRHCQHCGRLLGGPGPYCSDRCYYHGNRHCLPQDKRHLAAWDEELIPFMPIGLIDAFDVNRPDWHRWVYGGARR